MSERGTPDCATCGNSILTSHGRVRARRRGYGFCTQKCEASMKRRAAAENASMNFMRRVVFAGDDECWSFRGAKHHSGYHVFNYRPTDEARQRPVGAHRMMWLILNGPIPRGLEVCHACDNRACCNPGHLWLGTHQENMDDMAQKGRGSKLAGEATHSAKLTTQDVLAIRASSEPNRVLAKRYGVGKAQIYVIRARKAWKHV